MMSSRQSESGTFFFNAGAAHSPRHPPAGWTFEGGDAEAFRQAMEHALTTYRQYPDSFRWAVRWAVPYPSRRDSCAAPFSML